MYQCTEYRAYCTHTVSVRATIGVAQRSRNTKPPYILTRRNSTIMRSIEAAIAAIEALEPGESFTYTEIAAAHGVERVTLSRRHQQSQASRATQAVKQRKLDPQQELELVRYIEGLTKRRLLSI